MNAPMHGILAPLFNFSDFVMITPRDLKMNRACCRKIRTWLSNCHAQSGPNTKRYIRRNGED